MRTSHIFRLILAAATCLPALSHAALGDNESSIATDQKKMRASMRNQTVRDRYTVHEMQNEAGITVREYVAPDGTVFAVAWSGPAKPNLSQLLGKYFARYQSAGRTPGTSHRHSTVRDSDLVVHSSGHMRAFSGVAYLPQQLPAGVDVEEIQ